MRALATSLVEFLAALGPWAPAAYVALFAGSTVACLPATFLGLAGGALFGVGRGFALTMAGAILGASISFALARTFLRGPLLRRFGERAWFRRIDEASARSGALLVIMVRLSPPFPFTLVNYAWGLTAVRRRDYLIGFLGVFPAFFPYVFTGHLAGQAARTLAGLEPAEPPWLWAMRVAGLVATLAALFLVARRIKPAPGFDGQGGG